MRGLDAQARARGVVLQPQAVEVRVQDAEKHVHICSRRKHRESALVSGAVRERERECHAPGDAVRVAEPQRERIEKPAEDEKHRLDGFDLALEIEGLRKFLRRAHEPQRAFRAPRGALPELRGFRAESVHDVAARQARELREIVNPPIPQDREQFGRGIQFVQREICEECLRRLHDEHGSRVPCGDEGEIGICRDADLSAQPERGEICHGARAEHLPIFLAPRSRAARNTAEVHGAKTVRRRLDFRRERARDFQQHGLRRVFLRGAARDDYERGTAREGLRGGLPHSDARGFRNVVDFEDARLRIVRVNERHRRSLSARLRVQFLAETQHRLQAEIWQKDDGEHGASLMPWRVRFPTRADARWPCVAGTHATMRPRSVRAASAVALRASTALRASKMTPR